MLRRKEGFEAKALAVAFKRAMLHGFSVGLAQLGKQVECIAVQMAGTLFLAFSWI